MALRWQLANGLRDGSLSLDNCALQEHLRHTVVNQIAIDQPKYSGREQSRMTLNFLIASLIFMFLRIEVLELFSELEDAL